MEHGQRREMEALGWASTGELGRCCAREKEVKEWAALGISAHQTDF
jgi:hypothetical protein